jgi:hypothetical protein
MACLCMDSPKVHKLFLIVSRINKKPRKHPPQDAIGTEYDYTILIRIEQQRPYSLHKISVEMFDDG